MLFVLEIHEKDILYFSSNEILLTGWRFERWQKVQTMPGVLRKKYEFTGPL